MRTKTAILITAFLASVFALTGLLVRGADGIEGPKTSEPGELVILKAITKAPGAAWARVPAGTNWLPVDSGKTVVFATSKKGDYTFLLATAEADVPHLYQHTVTIGGGSPEPEPPTPGPGPGPNPDPNPPTPSKLWITIVEESGERTPQQAVIYASKDIAAYCQSGGHKLRLVDKDVKDETGSTPSKLKPWIERAAGKKLPYVVITDPNGRVLVEQTLPSSEADTLSLFKRLGG